MTAQPNDLLVIEDVTYSSSNPDTGGVEVNTGDVASNAGLSAKTPIWGPDGFISAPNPPDDNGACQVITQIDGDDRNIIATRDQRQHDKIGNVAPGDRMIVSRGAARFILKGEKNSVTLMTTVDGTDDGQAIYCTISPEKGFEVSTPWGRMSLGPLGFHVKHSGGARIDLGSVQGLAGPLGDPAFKIGSYASIDAGMTNIRGAIVNMGTDGGLASDTGTTALLTFLTALVEAIGTITAATPGAEAMAPMTAALEAATPFIRAIGKTI
jgi:hypothetical protein